MNDSNIDQEALVKAVVEQMEKVAEEKASRERAANEKAAREQAVREQEMLERQTLQTSIEVYKSELSSYGINCITYVLLFCLFWAGCYCLLITLCGDINEWTSIAIAEAISSMAIIEIFIIILVKCLKNFGIIFGLVASFISLLIFLGIADALNWSTDEFMRGKGAIAGLFFSGILLMLSIYNAVKCKNIKVCIKEIKEQLKVQ